jgi:hypothetical protein
MVSLRGHYRHVRCALELCCIARLKLDLRDVLRDPGGHGDNLM